MAIEDDPDAISGPEAENVIPFKRVDVANSRGTDGGERDDDELLRNAKDTIAKWQAASGIPSLTQVQELFYEFICAGASAMARDKIVAAIMSAFGSELGGKRALGKHMEPTCQTVCR